MVVRPDRRVALRGWSASLHPRHKSCAPVQGLYTSSLVFAGDNNGAAGAQTSDLCLRQNHSTGALPLYPGIVPFQHFSGSHG